LKKLPTLARTAGSGSFRRRRLQIARLIRERGLTEEEAMLRVDAQPPQEEKAARADVVVVNDGGLDELWQRVEAEWLRFQDRQAERDGGGA